MTRAFGKAVACAAILAVAAIMTAGCGEKKNKGEQAAVAADTAVTVAADTATAVDTVVTATTNNISNHWFGSYEIDINYGDSDEPTEHPQLIGYGIEISQDSCTFGGYGVQTAFDYLCKAQENGDELYLIFLKIIESMQYVDPSPLDTVATLIRDGQQYYVKSPEISDKDWNSDVKLPIEKKQRKGGGNE